MHLHTPSSLSFATNAVSASTNALVGYFRFQSLPFTLSMRTYRKILIAGTGTLASALIALAQHPKPKPGLYQVTNKMTWQQSPFPDDMQAPKGSGASHTAQTCITQAQIDKYNGPKPEAHGGSCQISDIQKRVSGMTAEISCGPPMTGKGTVETRWINSGHSKSKIHFTGSMHVGQNLKTIEWTVDSDSIYKGADCGSVKPAEGEQ